MKQLPADQRAVLELMLARGRNYTEIARLLSMDRDGVRRRALSAFEALGPQTTIDAESRALITDYLLGELPVRVRNDVRERLASEPAERAWARVVASEVAGIAARPLPEIPVAHDDVRHAEPEAGEARADNGAPTELDDIPAPLGTPDTPQAPAIDAPAPRPAPAPEVGDGAGAPAAEERAGARRTAAPAPAARAKRSSRLGGAIVLGIGALIAVAVIVTVIVVVSGGSSKHSTSKAASSATTTPPIIATVRLAPAVAGSKAQGVAEAFDQNGKEYLAIVAVNLAPNNKNYYAVWLSNGTTSNRLLGFANPGVGSDGRLQAATPLASGDSQYTRLLVTVETQAHPTSPGTVVLTGAFNLK